MSSLLRPGAFALAFLACAGGAQAHVTLETSRGTIGTTTKFVLRVPHGCGGEATRAVRVTLPDGVLGVKPMPKAGWTLDTVQGAYPKAYDLYGKPTAEGVREIVWRGELADAHYDEFVFRAYLAKELSPGPLPIPVVQDCATKAERWTAAGPEAEGSKTPAPVLTLVAQGAPATPQPASEVKAGSLVIADAWSRATPGGAKVAGGYLRITNTGAEPDRLVGGSAAVAGRFEVHSMSMDGGVMRMAPVEGGLVIPPGATVELKPGGYHAMLLDLKEPLREGNTVRGTLVFEKAGTVAITYRVGGLGAQGAPGAHHHH
ncbi:MAG TPA: copper chaperone PCu(A)C [Beijerinckiaceae bacterium]|jgi:copper(I)-binding protein